MGVIPNSRIPIDTVVHVIAIEELKSLQIFALPSTNTATNTNNTSPAAVIAYATEMPTNANSMLHPPRIPISGRWWCVLIMV